MSFISKMVKKNHLPKELRPTSSKDYIYRMRLLVLTKIRNFLAIVFILLLVFNLGRWYG